MSFINTTGILNDVQTMIQDNSPALRAKMMTWLNNIMIRLGNEFPWRCLLETATIAVASNAITLPTNFLEVDSITAGSIYFTNEDEVTLSNAFLWAAGGTVPIGYTIINGVLTFVPGTAAASVLLNYLQEPPSYTDSSSPTIYTDKFLPLIERTLLSAYYEFDADERANIFTVPFDPNLLMALKVTEVKNSDVARKYARWMKASAMLQGNQIRTPAVPGPVGPTR